MGSNVSIMVFWVLALILCKLTTFLRSFDFDFVLFCTGLIA